VHNGEAQSPIDYFSFLSAILAIHLCGAIGILIQQGMVSRGINLPLFVPCLMAGVLLTNVLGRTAPRIPWPSRTPALALIAEVALGVFLAMSLMSMELWSLADLAGPLFLALAVQALLAVAFAAFVAFRALDLRCRRHLRRADRVRSRRDADGDGEHDRSDPAAWRLTRGISDRTARRRVLSGPPEYPGHSPLSQPDLMTTRRSFGILRDKSLYQSIVFTRRDRLRLGLQGLLPHAVATQEELVERVMDTLRQLPRDLDRYMTLSSLQERNEHLFYRTVIDNLEVQALLDDARYIGYPRRRVSVRRTSHSWTSSCAPSRRSTRVP
jgi:hypothetical protein